MSKSFILFALLTLLTACGGGSGDNNTNTGNTNTSNNNSSIAQTSNLSGRAWRLCNSFSGTSTRFSDIFTETGFTAVYEIFINDSCSGTPDSSDEIVAGTYSSGSTVTTSGGFDATEIDFHVTSFAGVTLPAANQYSLYDIYYIDNDMLYYGVDRETSATNRTNTIQFSDAYIQSQ